MSKDTILRCGYYGVLCNSMSGEIRATEINIEAYEKQDNSNNGTTCNTCNYANIKNK